MPKANYDQYKKHLQEIRDRREAARQGDIEPDAEQELHPEVVSHEFHQPRGIDFEVGETGQEPQHGVVSGGPEAYPSDEDRG